MVFCFLFLLQIFQIRKNQFFNLCSPWCFVVFFSFKLVRLEKSNCFSFKLARLEKINFDIHSPWCFCWSFGLCSFSPSNQLDQKISILISIPHGVLLVFWLVFSFFLYFIFNLERSNCFSFKLVRLENRILSKLPRVFFVGLSFIFECIKNKFIYLYIIYSFKISFSVVIKLLTSLGIRKRSITI